MRPILASLFLAGCSAVVLAADPPAPAQPEKAKQPQPDMTAILAKNTIARKDIAFGKDEKQKLDVYSPRNGKGLPVVIYVHRGEWTKGDKFEVSYKPKFFNEHGVVFVSTNYRLLPGREVPGPCRGCCSGGPLVRRSHRRVWRRPKEDRVDGPFGRLPPRHAGEPRSEVPGRGETSAFGPARHGGLERRGLRPRGQGRGGGFVQAAHPERVRAGGIGLERRLAGDARQERRSAPPFLFASYEKGNNANKAAERLAGLIRDAKGKAKVIVLENRTHSTANHLLGAPMIKPETCCSASCVR